MPAGAARSIAGTDTDQQSGGEQQRIIRLDPRSGQGRRQRHEQRGRFVSSIAQEKKRNPRLDGERTLEEFRQIMAKLNLPYPKFNDHAVPGNRQCGVCPSRLPEDLEAYCRQMEGSPQG